MKIAVLSDIHSNYNAFKTCVEYALEKGTEHFLFLGDYVSDCAYPQNTMKLLYKLMDKYQCIFLVVTNILEENSDVRIYLKTYKKNPTRHLYQRVGFKKYDETDTHWLMER